MSTVRFFLIGFILGLLLCVAANLLAAQLQSDCGLPGLLKLAGCADDISRVGFPLHFYEEGGFSYRNNLDVGALVFDMLCGLGLAVLGGLLLQHFGKKKGSLLNF